MKQEVEVVGKQNTLFEAVRGHLGFVLVILALVLVGVLGVGVALQRRRAALRDIVPEPQVEVHGMFGFPGEETGTPTTLVLIRTDEHRVLVASSGEFGELVVQAARFSAVTTTGLVVTDANDDTYQDVIADGLVMYGGPTGLTVWEPQ